MRHLCSKGPCTAVGTQVLVFDASPSPDGTIGIRAHVYACDRHRDELTEAVKPYGEVDADSLM
jgi:Lon protease-like protein